MGMFYSLSKYMFWLFADDGYDNYAQYQKRVLPPIIENTVQEEAEEEGNLKLLSILGSA